VTEDRERYERLRENQQDPEPQEPGEEWDPDDAIDDLVDDAEYAEADVDGSVPGDIGYDAEDFRSDVNDIANESIMPGDPGNSAEYVFRFGKYAASRGSCLGCAGVAMAGAIVAVVVLWMLLVNASSGGDDGDAAAEGGEVAAAPAVEDLGIIEGPWRIRNEELVVGGATAGGPSVDRGTFTVGGGGSVLIGTPDAEGEAPLTFQLIESAPDRRVYETTFMGAVYTLVFDEAGHFTGEIVLDGTLQRRTEGWSELDEDGTPRDDLPEVSEASAPSTGTGSGGTVGSGCTETWMPPGFALDGIALASQPGGECAGVATGLDADRVTDLIVAEAARLGTEAAVAPDGSVRMGCVGDAGPVRFDLLPSAGMTLVSVSRGVDGC